MKKHQQHLLSLAAVGLLALPLASNHWHELIQPPSRVIAQGAPVSEIDALLEEIKLANDHSKILEKELEDAKRVQLQDDEECDKQQKRIESLEKNIELRKEEIKRLYADLEKIEQEALCAQEEVDELKVKIEGLNNELKVVEASKEKLQKELQEKEERIAEQKELLAEKTRRLAEQENKNKEIQALHDTYVCESDIKIKNLNSQLDQFVKDQQNYTQMMMTMNQMMLMMMMNQQQSRSIGSQHIWGIPGMDHVYMVPASLGEQGISHHNTLPRLMGVPHQNSQTPFWGGTEAWSGQQQAPTHFPGAIADGFTYPGGGYSPLNLYGSQPFYNFGSGMYDHMTTPQFGQFN